MCTHTHICVCRIFIYTVHIHFDVLPCFDNHIVINTSCAPFQEKFSTASVGVKGSGWGWLGYCPKNDKVAIATCQNQDPLQLTHGMYLHGCYCSWINFAIVVNRDGVKYKYPNKNIDTNTLIIFGPNTDTNTNILISKSSNTNTRLQIQIKYKYSSYCICKYRTNFFTLIKNG